MIIQSVMNPQLCCLPENFLWPQTLKVSTHRVKPLKCGLHTQGAKEILWAHFVKVKGDTSNVSPSARLVIGLRFVDEWTLQDQRQSHLKILCIASHACLCGYERTTDNSFNQTYRLWSPCLSWLQGHEHGVVRKGHEELIRVYFCTVLLTNQRQRHGRQGQQQSLANLQHTCKWLWIHVIKFSPFISLPIIFWDQGWGHPYPLSELLQSPGCDALPGVPVVTAHSEGTLWWRPHSLGYRSEKWQDRNVIMFSAKQLCNVSDSNLTCV